VIIAGAGLAGAVGLSLLTDWYYRSTDPRVTHDGQYGMIFFFLTGPAGWLLGFLLGVILANRAIKQLEKIKWLVCILVILAGLLISPFLGLLPFMVIGYFSR